MLVPRFCSGSLAFSLHSRVSNRLTSELLMSDKRKDAASQRHPAKVALDRSLKTFDYAKSTANKFKMTISVVSSDNNLRMKTTAFIYVKSHFLFIIVVVVAVR